LRNVPGHELRDQRNGVLPLSLIHSRSDVQTVLAYLVSLAQQRLGFDSGDVLDASKVVSELCYNVVDHSQTHGVAVARIGQDRQGRRYVSLAVADAGVGVRASLSSRYPEAAQWRHGDAIQRALGGLSSRASGGGAGLRSIYAVVRRYGGRLAIRSGDERLYVSAEHQPRALSGAWFPGTQVGISFSQR
jgi:anti-sigma regulatory factor (Ser/Thr protein kinase)